MRITGVRATAVNIPLIVPFLFSVGSYPGDTKVVVEVLTDEGITGLGEAPSPECCALINERLGPALAGLDPLDIQACERACLPDLQVMPNTSDSTLLRAFGGIEIGLWDIRGKAFRQPLYMLLGGAFRKEIPFAEYFAFRQIQGGMGGERTPGQIAEYCARMADQHGSTMFEGKLQLGDPLLEIASVKAIREAIGPAAMLRLDGNMSWSLPTARRILAEIEPYDIRNYEDPVATFEGMEKLRSTLLFPSRRTRWTSRKRSGSAFPMPSSRISLCWAGSCAPCASLRLAKRWVSAGGASAEKRGSASPHTCM